MLSDRDILAAIGRKDLLFDPPVESAQIQPCSVDLRLGDAFRPVLGDVFYIEDEFTMDPGEFILGSTMETVGVGSNHALRVEGKSSWGRVGLAVHITAGFIDPGFIGQITLELKNVSSHYITLRRGDPICQVAVFELSSGVENPYGHLRGSHYQGQQGPTPSRFESRVTRDDTEL